jgi:hypothetical protein
MELTKEILNQLGQPFGADEVEFLPKAQSNGKALGLAYIDARVVMRRLDEVVPGDWSFDFDLLDAQGKMVRGRLTVCGVTRCDAGEADREEETLKSAVSDALKRAAVHFGIGRYLYHLPQTWAPYDAQKRRFTETPQLDPRAIQRALKLAGVAATAPVAAAAPAPRQQPQEAPRPNPRTEQAVQASEKGNAYAYETGARQPAPPKQEAEELQMAAPAPTGALVCLWEDCGAVLTKGQHDISVRAFGQPFCPAHQKEAKERA